MNDAGTLRTKTRQFHIELNVETYRAHVTKPVQIEVMEARASWHVSSAFDRDQGRFFAKAQRQQNCLKHE